MSIQPFPRIFLRAVGSFFRGTERPFPLRKRRFPPMLDRFCAFYSVTRKTRTERSLPHQIAHLRGVNGTCDVPPRPRRRCPAEEPRPAEPLPSGKDDGLNGHPHHRTHGVGGALSGRSGNTRQRNTLRRTPRPGSPDGTGSPTDPGIDIRLRRAHSSFAPCPGRHAQGRSVAEDHPMTIPQKNSVLM